jgi:hypothetical protein
MFLPIEIKVGCMAVGICPVEKVNGYPIQNLILGEVQEIKTKSYSGKLTKMIKLKADNTVLPGPTVMPGVFQPTVTKKITIYDLPDWRIAEFDFGGVNMTNRKFDPMAIKNEDEKIIKKWKP